MDARRNYQESSLGRYPPYGEGASRSGGSCSIATSLPEPDSECARSNGVGSGGATRVIDQHGANPSQWPPRNGARYWAGYQSGKYRARFRGFLHHEVERSRDGTVDLSVDHRCPRGPAVGRHESITRGGISVHLARVKNELMNSAIR